MDAQKLVIIYVIVIFAVILSLLRLRKGPPRPTKLNMKGGGDSASSPLVGPEKQVPGRAPEDTGPGPKERVLNRFFEFEGQSYDAYEVLGVPAGASADQAVTAYSELRPRVDGNRGKILDLALNEIKSKQQN